MVGSLSCKVTDINSPAGDQGTSKCFSSTRPPSAWDISAFGLSFIAFRVDYARHGWGTGSIKGLQYLQES